MNFDQEQLTRAFDTLLGYVRPYPVLYEAVVEKLVILRFTLLGTSVIELVAARDAASSLVMIAREGQCFEMESYFYKLYETLCASLLAYYQGGLS